MINSLNNLNPKASINVQFGTVINPKQAIIPAIKEFKQQMGTSGVEGLKNDSFSIGELDALVNKLVTDRYPDNRLSSVPLQPASDISLLNTLMELLGSHRYPDRRYPVEQSAIKISPELRDVLVQKFTEHPELREKS